MITLCMDTSHIYLVIGLIQDDTLIGERCFLCPKQQSERLFPTLLELMEECHLSAQDIDQVCITKGPGSYTGVRIAMCVAKVLCSQKEIPLYTINTLDLYAGNLTGRVVLDARGHRVYTASYENGKCVEEVCIKDVDEINPSEKLIGDGQLFGKEQWYPNICEQFLLTKDKWMKEENVHTVVPEYYKSIDAYRVDK